LKNYQIITNYVNDDSEILRYEHPELKSKLILSGISNLNFWHGYEVLIDLISRYQGDLKVELRIFSYSNPYVISLKEKLQHQGSFGFVKFYLDCPGEVLLKNISDSHVFIDSLNRGVDTMNYSLKSRSYIEYGVPFISATLDPTLENQEFVYSFSQISSIDSVIDWYQNLKLRPSEIREFGFQKLNIYSHWPCILPSL
jgi:hypothetical protein